MTPNTTEEIKVQRSVLDLNTFDTITIAKVGSFTPVNDSAEALARLGNDTAKFNAALNEGLRVYAMRDLRATADGWKQMNDEGELEGEFSGIPADSKKVNAFILNIAKTVFGYGKDKTADQKKQAKDSAMEMAKTTPVILKGLQENCKLGVED